MATPAEITGIHTALEAVERSIDQALDRKDRRGFNVWCGRRRSLLTRLERHLVAVVTAEVRA